METTRLSSKGQVVVPKAVREAHGWRTGMEFAVEEVPGGVLLRPCKPFKRSKLKEVRGCLKYPGEAKSTAEMDSAIAASVKERHGRGGY